MGGHRKYKQQRDGLATMGIALTTRVRTVGDSHSGQSRDQTEHGDVQAGSSGPLFTGMKANGCELQETPWYPGRGSNPYASRPRILSPLRLPVSSPGLGGGGLSTIQALC